MYFLHIRALSANTTLRGDFDMTLTPKENDLLKDLKAQEELCVEKYGRYATAAHDSQLQNLLSKLQNEEQQHLDTITQIMNGGTPKVGPAPQSPQDNATATYGMGADPQNKKDDQFMCQDLLAIEKHASSAYNTSVFEFCNATLRDTLSHLQKEEQNHGKELYDYMAKNGMYN